MSGRPEWMLAVDASTVRASVVLGRCDEGPWGAVLEDDASEGGRQASALLPRRIAALAAQAGIRVADVGLVACGRGPGTFTGTRVAVALCKGLAEGLGCGVVAVSTLAAQAASIDRTGDTTAVLDARRGEVYAARFAIARDTVAPLSDERCATIDEVLQAGAGDHFVGPGVAAYRERFADDVGRTELPGPSARGLWRAACAALDRTGPQDAARLEAVYLRESYAQLGVNVPRNPMFRSPWI